MKLEHVHLKTRDPAAAAKFYIETLGATPVPGAASAGGYRVDLHGITVNITGFIAYQTREQKYGLEHFAIETDRFDATIEKMKAAGGKVLETMISRIPAHAGARICWVEGPEGVQFELIEKK